MTERDIVDGLIQDIEESVREAFLDLGAHAADLGPALAAIREDAVAAAEAHDLEHIAKLRHELPAILAAKGIRLRAANRERVHEVGGRIVSALFAVLARALARIPGAAALLLLGLSLAVGCGAATRPGTVPSVGILGDLGNVCGFDAECMSGGHTPGAQEACTRLHATLTADPWPDVRLVAGDVDELCEPATGSVAACLAERDDLHDYQRRSATRWCQQLEDVVAAALAE